MNDQDTTSTRPYLIRALYGWCTDNGLTPHVVVRIGWFRAGAAGIRQRR